MTMLSLWISVPFRVCLLSKRALGHAKSLDLVKIWDLEPWTNLS